MPVLTEWRAELERTVGAGRFSILVVDDGSTDATPARLAGLCLAGARRPQAHEPRARPELPRRLHRGRADGGRRASSRSTRTGSAIPWDSRASGRGGTTRPRSTGEGRAGTTAWPAGSSAASCGRRSRSRAARGSTTRTSPSASTDAPARRGRRRRGCPPDFNLANIAMALLLEPEGFEEVPIHFRDRIGGQPAVRLWGFVPKALRLHRDVHQSGALGDARQLRLPDRRGRPLGARPRRAPGLARPQLPRRREARPHRGQLPRPQGPRTGSSSTSTGRTTSARTPSSCART